MKATGVASAVVACLTTLSAGLSPLPIQADDSILLRRDLVGEVDLEERGYHNKHHRKQVHDFRPARAVNHQAAR